MMLGYERRDMTSYRIPIIAAIIGIAALLTASFYTSASLDKQQNTTSGPTTAETGSMGAGTDERRQVQNPPKSDNQKPPAPAARP
jgi:hypothetical protein